MTSSDAHDLNAAEMGGLRRLAPDPQRAERVQARCRTRLEQSRRRTERADVGTGAAWRLVAPALVGGFCVLYLFAFITTTLRFEGILR